MRANDTLRTGPSVPGLVVRVALVVAVAAGAAMLCPLLGWQVAAVVLAIIAPLFRRPSRPGGRADAS